MSNYLAIATATAALRQIISDAVRDTVAGAQVSMVTPDNSAPKPPEVGVNVFLYGVSPNPSLRNEDLPTRRPDGAVVRRPQAALNLHYLLTFYGDETKLEPQVLLGRVAAALHARPVLTRAKVQEVVAANAFLAGSDLADAVERVRFAPEPMSLEELSKLWSVLFQTTYALSAAYVASVVLIEADEELPRPALPVAGRGFHFSPFGRPQLRAVFDATAPDAPIVASSVLRLEGTGLAGEDTVVRIAGVELIPDEVTDARIAVSLASVPAADLRAGVYGVQVVHRRAFGTPPTPRPVAESNAVPIVLRPTVNRRSADPADPEHDITYTPGADPVPPRITLTVTPPVGVTQRAVLLLNELTSAPAPRAAAYAARPRAADTDTLEFDVPGLEAGTYLVRVQVDGAESVAARDASGAYERPRVVVP
ncbi:MAG TPA: DUF4255 domain-containing protein [Longimicrobiales bacterium]